MNFTLIILIIVLAILLITSINFFKIEKNNIFRNLFLLLNLTFCIHVTSLILQIVFSNTAIPPIYFDYITYLGGSFTPLLFLFISLKYSNNKFNLKKIRFLLIIPIIALMFLWTNDLHGLFYKQYSTNLNETVYGPILILYAIYTYFTLIFSMIVLIISSIKKSGFFSIQTGLVVLGIIIPLSANLLGLLKIIPMTIYMTPILFIATSICISISIFKYKALNITPVAFKTVINTMSDAFIVISDDGTIVESNLTFQNIFKDIMSVKKEDNFFNIIDKTNCMNLQELKEHIDKTRENGDIVTDEYHINIDKFNKYFEVDIHPVKASKGKNEYVATLLLFKDITQHKEDIAKIEEKQEIIVKQGQLVSIGELAGGVAHDINTPISAIQTGILMLREMTSERTEQEKEILQRMDNCAVKIINIVNSMRNQIRNLGGDTNVKFKINDVINDIKMITYHEFKKRDAKLNIDIQDDLSIQGDPTKLGQVLTNLVMNGLQAYKEIKGGKIDVILTKAPDNMALIKVTDYAGGIDDSIAPYVFKNILSTKGNVGTGLGLYLAYSVVKGNFNGEITFDTEKNIGTTFYITLPRA